MSGTGSWRFGKQTLATLAGWVSNHPDVSEVALHAAILILAFLYSSVGHAGASGYIAAMTLAGVAVPEIRPAALMMNLGVACFGMWHFIRGGHLRWSLTWPFLVAALPLAFLGGRTGLPPATLGLILGGVLLFSAVRFLWPIKENAVETRPPRLPVALAVGAALGYLAGLTGTGGGIFLTPLLLVTGWANPKTAAASSIVFIAGNSLTGLLGHAFSGAPIPWHLASLLPFALAGGFAGSRLGSYHYSANTVRRLLAVVLLVAAVKLLANSLPRTLHAARLPPHWSLIIEY